MNLGLPSLLLFCGLNENPRRLLREWRMQVTKSFCFRGHTLQSRWRMRRRRQQKKKIKLFNWVEMKIIHGDLLKTNDNRMVRRRDIPEELRGG